jgi:hypothetical protein
MKLNWGKPRIIVRKCSDLATNPNPFLEFPTPVQSSTTLDTTKGDKVEAKVEGGENEDVRYNRNTYAFTTRIRTLKNRIKPIFDDDGLIADEYEVYVQPEDPTAPGMFISRATASVADQFNADDGGAWEYVFDALKNKEAGKGQIQWGVVTISGSGSELTASFTPVGTIGLTPNVLLFSEEADASGIDVIATETGASAVSSETWCTTTVSGYGIKVKVSANAGAERSAIITVTKGTNVGYITVIQEAGN